MPTPSDEFRDWSLEIQNEHFICSTNPALIQLDALNAALESPMLWWARRLPDETLQRMVDNSLCLGLYVLKPQPEGSTGSPSQTMVGFARVVTDYVTFGYLTDVYILSEYQGRGLARWLMERLDEVLNSWPDLRRFLILTSNPGAIKLYEKTLGAKDVREDPQASKLVFLEKHGGGTPTVPADH